MANFVQVPVSQVPADSLRALLEEFASRDGTDYGEQETPLAERVSQLHTGLQVGAMALVFDADTETWDILSAEHARPLLGDEY